jgi:hypothetical protein
MGQEDPLLIGELLPVESKEKFVGREILYLEDMV